MSEESVEERLTALESNGFCDVESRIQDLESEFETMRADMEDHIAEDTDDINEPE